MIRILHISDFHFGKSVSYDQDQVQRALVEHIEHGEEAYHGIIASGDIAYSGRTSEYVLAEKFFRELMAATAVPAAHFAMCPGNHDVDRQGVVDLARSLADTERSDQYFANSQNCIHIEKGQAEFGQFYERLLGREFGKKDSINGPLIIEDQEVSLELWEMNTAIFCRGEDDHGKLWVGRSSISRINPQTQKDGVLRFLIGHHPLEWLASEEESRVRALIEQRFDAYLRGHLHRGGYAATASGVGELIQISAGATYQGADNPIEANVIEIDSNRIAVRPFRYVDNPLPAWVPDNGKLGPGGATEVEFTISNGNKAAAGIVGTIKTSPAKFSHAQLFTAADDEPIFATPRVCAVPFSSVSPEQDAITEIDLIQLLRDQDQIQIEVGSEHGATTLAHYMAYCCINNLGNKAQVVNASSVPNYKTKLDKYIETDIERATTVLIIDEVIPADHKKMIDAVLASGRFQKVVAICPSALVSSVRDLNATRNLFDSAPVYAWPLDRARLRQLAIQVFNPKFEEDVAFAVEKTYLDLVSLAIPLTPSNVIMYLHILKNEGDFVPLDRVSIIQRYITDALTRASDQISSEFGVRDRVSLLSSFVFDLFMLGKTSFIRQEWRDFCRQFQDRTFSDFEPEGVLNQLLRSRVIVEYGARFYVRYAFVYDFLVGMHAASSPDKLSAFLTEGHHRKLPRVVEVMAAIALDPTPLIDTLQADLDRHLDEFKGKYVAEPHDPVALAIWKVEDQGQEEKYWSAIQGQMEEGPAPSAAIDKVKESLLAESRSADQEVLIQDFSALEIELFRSCNALESALRVAVSLDGQYKLNALRSIFRTELIVLQIATAFSKKLALSRVLQWGGLLFVNSDYDPSKTEEDFGDLVPAVVFGIDYNITEILREKLGTKRLGATFRAILSKAADLSEFEMFNLFALILQTKPRGWEEDLASIVTDVDYKKWRQNGFVTLLMDDYKHEANTVENKGKIRHLVALVEAKRSMNQKRPGAKLVGKVEKSLIEKGRFDTEDTIVDQS